MANNFLRSITNLLLVGCKYFSENEQRNFTASSTD